MEDNTLTTLCRNKASNVEKEKASERFPRESVKKENSIQSATKTFPSLSAFVFVPFAAMVRLERNAWSLSYDVTVTEEATAWSRHEPAKLRKAHRSLSTEALARETLTHLYSSRHIIPRQAAQILSRLITWFITSSKLDVTRKRTRKRACFPV